MTVKKEKAEIVVYSFATFLTISGAALCLAGILVPNWYEVVRGNTVTHLGLWQDKICFVNSSCSVVNSSCSVVNSNCSTYWLSDDSYERTEDMPAWKLILGFETAATVISFLALLSLIPLWATKFMYSSDRIKTATFSVFYASNMISAFLAVVGCLIISSKGTIKSVDSSKETIKSVDFAPFLSGIGGAALFLAGCMSCVVCRYDPTYGTLENPVSPNFLRA